MPISGSTKALEYARLHVMRLGASRLDYYQPWFKVLIAGVDVTGHARISGCSITQELNNPHTMTLRVSGMTPTSGQEILVYMGDTTVSHCLFGGHILHVSTTYEDLPTNVAYDLSCIGYSWRLTHKTVSASFTSTDATTIVKTLMATYASWATVNNVVAGLPTISAINFTGSTTLKDALDQVAKAIGGYWYLDYGKDLHFFITDTTGNAQAVTDTRVGPGAAAGGIFGWSMAAAEGNYARSDLSQVRTRAVAIGTGSQASTSVSAGSTTLPVVDGTAFSSSGGFVQAGAQRISYTGKSTLDGQGALVAGTPGSSPSSPSPVEVSPHATGNLSRGTNPSSAQSYQYVCTFVSALGESSASPAAALAISAVGDAGSVGSFNLAQTTGGSLTPGNTYFYTFTFVSASGESAQQSLGFYQIFVDASHNAVSITSIPTANDPRVTARKIYRIPLIGGQPKLVTTISDNATTTFTDTVAEASLGAQIPTSDTASTGQATVGLPIGPAGTTARKLYRTTLGGASFLLQSTTSDNTTASITDNTADGSLGAAFSGAMLGVAPGNTSITVSDLSKFPDGGWVRCASQVMSFTSRSATSGTGTLNGVPASGNGSVTAIIPAGTTITVEPTLLGVPASSTGSIGSQINAGDTVSIRVETNDSTAQTALATALGSGDGVVEAVLSDSAWNLTQCAAEGAAELALYKNALASLRGTTRDQSVKLGRNLSVTLTTPPISGSYQIQRIVLSDIAIAGQSTTPGGSKIYVFPMRTVDGSSARVSFENLIQTLLRSAA